jgi:xanthine dehydrogenase accessory factor
VSAWVAPLSELVRRGERCVLVTVAAVRGSAPRESGTKMIVTATDTRDTIGGGNLELAAIERARAMLAARADASPAAELVRYPLGPGMRQCCGGAVRILFELVDARSAAWVEALAGVEREGEPAVVATLASGPRAGRKLLVAGPGAAGSAGGAAGTAGGAAGTGGGATGTAGGATGTAGGAAGTAGGATGSLGDAATDATTAAAARDLLGATGEEDGPRLRRIACAHGHALVLLEPVRPCDFHVLVFGAGHVGRALVDVLARAECRITWVDTRSGQLPDTVPANVRPVRTDEPVVEVDRAGPGACCVVMTHSHALDYELVERALTRGDFAYVGMIGSTPKRNRLLKYLEDEGMDADRIARLTCPIGVPGIGGKHPATIAIAVAAQLLQTREAAGGADAPRRDAAARERRRRTLERQEEGD